MKINEKQKEILIKIGLVILIPLFLYLLEYLIIKLVILLFIHIIFPLFNLIFKYTYIPLFFIVHYFLARVIIRSFIFPSGNCFKKFIYYNDYLGNFNKIVSKILNFEEFNDIKKYFHIIENINKVNNELNQNENFLFKYQNNLSLKLNNLVEIYYQSLENSNLQNNFLTLSQELKNNLSYLNEFCEIWKFDYSKYLIFLNKLLDYELKLKRNFEKINIDKDFEIIYLKPKEEKEKILLIYCPSNAVFIESFSLTTKLIDIYLKQKNISILLWNYKGYGLRKGNTTFRNIDIDIDLLVNYIKKNFNNYKYLIHGLSIGGYSSIRLSEKLLNNNKNNVILICDRTYSDVNLIVEDLFGGYGEIIKYIYDLFCPYFIENSSNVEKFINFKGKKMIIWSLNDEMIKLNSSLFNSVRKHFFDDVLFQMINNIFCVIKVNENIKIDNFYDYIIENENELLYYFKNCSSSFEMNFFIENVINILEEKNGKKKLIDYFLSFGFPLINTEFLFSKKNNEFIKSYNENFDCLIKLYNSNFINEKIKKFISRINFFFVKLYFKSNINDKDLLNMNTKNIYFNEINNEINNKINEYFGFVIRLESSHMNPLIYENDYIKNYFTNFITED